MIYEAVLTDTSQRTSLPVLECIEHGKREWIITLKHDAGESSAPFTLEKAWKIVFRCKAAPEARGIKIEQTCSVVAPQEGRIKLELGPDQLKPSGMWYGAIQIMDEDGALIEQFPCWLMVKQALTVNPKLKQLTVGDVRAFLWDRCAEDNRLLDAVQFTDDQIMQAMSVPVDEFNATSPAVAFFNTTNFPWRSQWLKGTAAYLLRQAAVNQIRNNASYQAGTVSVNDSDKGPIFQQLGDQLYKEWFDWVKAKKREINIELGWGRSAFIEF